MCGIAGYIGPHKVNLNNIKSTLNLMDKRGPDNQNYFLDKDKKFFKIFLHSRLSIIDLQNSSNQPFRFKDYSVIFNGEIYNYLELKKELLDKGHKFKTKSDTEVLLKSYIEYGFNCVKKFTGMWSFAIYDKKKNIIFLSRDYFGEKPLFYYYNNNEFIFASEIKFINSLKKINNQPNIKKIKFSLNLGYKSLHYDNETFFKNIYSVEPGHSIIINSQLGLKKINNKKLEKKKIKKNSYDEIVYNTKELIKKSLSLRLRSDVPIAFCLSGGIDSAFLASLAVKEFNQKIKTFSIIDNNKKYNEKKNIDKIIQDLKCENTQIKLKKSKNFLNHLQDLTIQHDSPISTISYYVHSFLSEKISKSGFKVAISGTGADEIFTGYYDHYLLYFASVNNFRIKNNELIYWKKHVYPKIRNNLLKDPNLYLNNKNKYNLVFDLNKSLKKIIKKPIGKVLQEKQLYQKNILRNRMLNELFYQIVPVILHHDDLNSMMYSVENRSPFLDKELLNYSINIPTKYLIKEGYQKSILRDASKGILLDEIRMDRQKFGFNASLSSLTDINTIKHFLLKDKSNLSDIINYKKLFNHMEIFKNQKTGDFDKFLFNILNLKLFLDNNF